jgi:hypothetical protein
MTRDIVKYSWKTQVGQIYQEPKKLIKKQDFIHEALVQKQQKIHTQNNLGQRIENFHRYPVLMNGLQ